MENVIVYADELAAQAREKHGTNYRDAAAHVQMVALQHHPIYLGLVNAVVYNDKTDRYVAKFGPSSAKLSSDVAQFLLAEVWNPTRNATPTVYAHMCEGTVDSVLLMFISKT